ncbi:Putetive hypothetical protein [Sorangium cellulosum]|uniref:Uncharacterized protein n=1 Tax=Sorangium cellulosum TaxID=56 RepID=A0A2L0ERK0_SORCE|nr:hypothetical protein [Sorangium cellulosum]AUX41905.1 Putetive hypothetical protein [Sorangium cellulosum]
MSRDAHIPLALWICAAIVAHMAGGGGAVEVAQVIEDRAQLRWMVHAVREGLRPSDTTFEVLTDGIAPTPPPTPLAPPERAADDPADTEPDTETPPDPEQKPDPAKVAKATPPKPPPTQEPPPQAKAPPPPPPKPEPPKPEVAQVVPVQPKPPPPPPPPPSRRLAVRQHVEKDQEDNPEANRIADDANKVAEETMAQIRSKDQDDPAPTPGTPSGPMGPKDMVGDSDHDRSGHSEQRAGDEKRAPGERNPESRSAEHHNPATSKGARTPAAGPPPSVPGAKGGGRVAQAPPALPAPARGAEGGAGPASPEVVDSAREGYTLNPANPGGDGKGRIAGKKATPQPYQSPVRVGSLGLGAPGLPGGRNLNLNMARVQEAVGNEKLLAERAADGASRRSAHRGSWEITDKWKKWRAAIENYDPSVKPGNQTSLNAARAPFATYINMIHNRIHPIFAEEFLMALDGLPKGHAFNQNLVTHVEMVLNKDSGTIVRLGVTRPSGMTAFDIVALNSVSRASPFGKAPDVIASPDGNVYLHWEFHRDPVDACGTRNVYPYLLKDPPAVAPTDPAPVRKAPRPVPGDEKTLAPRGPLLPLRP